MNDIREAIASKALERGVCNLVHFTRQENLESIKAYGLIPRQELENSSAPFIFNDRNRIDGFPNSISLSVTSPNYKMFYSYRQRDTSTRWAVIFLNANKVLRNCDCAFNYTNAANNAVTRKPIESRKNLAAFESMFYDARTRKARGLKDNESTDPQAEILCFDPIPPDFLEDIVFSGEAFTYRHDWAYWKPASRDEDDDDDWLDWL